jgi:hypothetical protein
MAKRVSKKQQAEDIASRIVKAPAGSQPTTVRQRVQAMDPSVPVEPYPSSPRKGKAAGELKADATREATTTAEVTPTGYNPAGSKPFGEQPRPRPPLTTSEGIGVGRATRLAATRGHNLSAAHIESLRRSAEMLDVSPRVGTAGQITGLSRDTPVAHPRPVRLGGGEKSMGYSNPIDRTAPVYTTGMDISKMDMGRWGDSWSP